MLENDSNRHAKDIFSAKECSAESLIPFLDCNIKNEEDIRIMILKLERIVKTLEDEVISLKQKVRNKIN